MITLIKRILQDETGGLGITRASMVSAITDSTGDSSDDAVVKIRRLINRRGRSFCAITNFPFLHSEINFNITSSAYQYSGASYLPATYKRITGAYIKESGDSRHYPLEEINASTFFNEENPEYRDGRPDKFCIQLTSSGYWQIIFNKTPDTTYTVYLNIESQWTDLTADDSETVITKPYYDYFVHYCIMARLKDQGDLESYQTYKNEWDSPASPRNLLNSMLNMLSGVIKHKGVKVDHRKNRPHRIGISNIRDYGLPPNDDDVGYD